MIVFNLVALLVYPIFISYSVQSVPLAASVLVISSSALLLKLISFHHVMHDNRKLLRRLSAEGPIDPKVNKSGLPNDVYELALQYPKNLRFFHFVRFFLAPTCCYQLVYPSTDRIRPIFLLRRFLEIFLCTFIIVYLSIQHIKPIAIESVTPLRERNYIRIILQTLHMAVPAAYLWLSGFYLFFHSYMNFWGELTYFADRRFYHDWWNAGDLSEYWRKWNFPIHSFLIRHVYFPLRRRKVNKALAMLATFLISAVAHEYLMIGIIRSVNFIAFTIMIVNVPIMIIQQKLKHVSN